MSTLVQRSLAYIKVGLDFFILHSGRPNILGLVTNDTCNLHCIDCRVANVSNETMNMKQVESILDRYRAKGVRMLYLTGGEPYLWRDGRHRLPDIVRLAHDKGYLRVHVYTNGTLPLSNAPDFTWISVDGIGSTFEKIRGIPLERVLRNARGFEGRHAIIFTINTVNCETIRESLAYLADELPGVGTMFFFHTPYYGIDELYLSQAQRENAVDTLLACKKDGFPVLNSRTALSAYLSGNAKTPLCDSWIVDATGEYRCCRVEGDPDICKDCGYSSGYEIAQARRWRPGAIRTLLRTH
jgi:MoaA/NifB/PqqE/SkfB family radical SAM enzyme